MGAKGEIMKPGIAALVLTVLAAPAVAGTNNLIILSSFQVPALDEIGLSVLIALVAGVAGWAVRKRARK
jgi:hypothetical protein